MNRHPWSDISPPTSAGDVSARRVDPDGRWDFFWGRNHAGEHLLLLWHSEANRPEVSRLPRLQGVTVTVSQASEDQRGLIFRLVERQHRDIFHALCLDIIAAANVATSEREAVQGAIQRTWRWHHLLKGGRDRRLSEQEQKGLIGELYVLKELLLPIIGPGDAVNAWNGPLGDPKDFSIGKVAVESKARRGVGRPFASISSEFQLDSTENILFLHVIEIDRAASGQTGALSLPDLILETEAAVKTGGIEALDGLEERLAAAGYRSEDDYSGFRWAIKDGDLYRVADDFPRITASELRAGVRDVGYSIDLVQCTRFAAERSELIEEIRGGRSVDID